MSEPTAKSLYERLGGIYEIDRMYEHSRGLHYPSYNRSMLIVF